MNENAIHGAPKRLRMENCTKESLRMAPNSKVERPVVHVDPATGKVNGPCKKKLRMYWGIVTHDKVHVTYNNWK